MSYNIKTARPSYSTDYLDHQTGIDQEMNLAGIVVNTIKQYPCLWNTKLRSYKDLTMKEASWKEMQTKLKVPGKGGNHLSKALHSVRRHNVVLTSIKRQ